MFKIQNFTLKSESANMCQLPAGARTYIRTRVVKTAHFGCLTALRDYKHSCVVFMHSNCIIILYSRRGNSVSTCAGGCTCATTHERNVKVKMRVSIKILLGAWWVWGYCNELLAWPLNHCFVRVCDTDNRLSIGIRAGPFPRRLTKRIEVVHTATAGISLCFPPWWKL